MSFCLAIFDCAAHTRQAWFDSARPNIANLMVAMLQARDAVERRSWAHPQEPTDEEWWADVRADPRAQKRERRNDLAVKQAFYRLADETQDRACRYGDNLRCPQHRRSPNKALALFSSKAIPFFVGSRIVSAAMAEPSPRNFTINFDPQHPAAHGVPRLVLELDGEVATGRFVYRLASSRHREACHDLHRPVAGVRTRL